MSRITFCHLGDLHLGIKFHKRSLVAHQKHALEQVLTAIKEQGAHTLIAGDVYDTVNPSIEAQELWYWFLKELGEYNILQNKHAIIIPGNHDSAARLSLGVDFMHSSNIHIVTKDQLFFEINIEGVPILAIPFTKPTTVEQHLGIEVETYDEAFAKVIEASGVVDKEHTLLLAHQTFEGGIRGESEFKPFMSDAVSTETVKDFSIVLAGHLHAMQTVGGNPKQNSEDWVGGLGNVYYCGSLLPYAFGDEYNAGISFVAYNPEENAWVIGRTPLTLMQKLTTVEGDLAHCLSVDAKDDFVKVKLVDCLHFDEALTKLEEHFPYLCCVVTNQNNDWEADLTKPIAAFGGLEEALDAFCQHLEVPKFNQKRQKLIQEALDAYTETRNQ